MNSLDTDQALIILNDIGVRYRTAQENISSFKEYVIRRVKRDIEFQNFWALKEVSLTINPGEVFGVVGPNGAGKSTLLKVIARVLKPTTGRVRIRGRVSPLLELGTGFHQELTGRENIYMNGAFLGFSKQDLDVRLNRIVDFAGLGDFIDAPIRTYSTGMVARLGFSVATDVRPEILIVDEILGVGDAEFQRKSYERIQRFQSEGTTILLVTHSLSRVEEMCSRAVWLDHGKVVMMDTAETVVGKYLERTTQQESKRLGEIKLADGNRRWGNGKIEITGVRILDMDGKNRSIFHTGQSMKLEIDYIVNEEVQSPVFGIAIYHHNGVQLTGPNTQLAGYEIPVLSGKGTMTFSIPYLPLLEGLFNISIAVVNADNDETLDYHNRAYQFRVINQLGPVNERYGLVTFRGEWQLMENREDKI